MINPMHNHLKVVVCNDAADAVAKGYDYVAQGGYKPIAVKEVVVVNGGMQSGASSVDFVLEDEAGQKYVFLVTGKLLKSIPC